MDPSKHINDTFSSSKSGEKFRRVKKSRVLYEGDVSAMRKKFIPSDIRYYLIQSVFVMIIIAALISLGMYLRDTGESQAQYVQVIEEYTEPEPIPTREMDPDTSAWPPIIDFAALQAINPDVCGWIRIPGTDVDYPVMANPERDYYLHRNMYRDSDQSGSIFVDYENNHDINLDPHVVIYGHHMNVSTMFHAVSLYRDPGFFDTHRVIYFETPALTYVLKPVGTYVAQDNEYDARKCFFTDSTDFGFYQDQRLERITQSRYDDFDRRVNDKVFTLITCTNSGASRLIVECVAEQVYPTYMIPNVVARALADNGVVLNANGKIEVPVEEPPIEGVVEGEIEGEGIAEPVVDPAVEGTAVSIEEPIAEEQSVP